MSTNQPPLQYTYRIVIPYTESSNPTKRFRIEYTIEAPDRETARQKAEREFNAYTTYNSASWVRVMERENVRVWRIMQNLPQTPDKIDDLAARLLERDPDVIYATLKTLGDLEDASVSSKVIPILDHENPELAALAAETLGKTGNSTDLPFLVAKYTPEAHPRLKASILSAIGKLASQDDPVADLIASGLGDSDNRVRANAVEALEMLRLPTTTRMLLPLMADEDNRVRANVLKALWATHDRRALATALGDMVSHSNRWMRASAAFVLKHIDIQNRVNMLSGLAHDSCPEVRNNAWKALLDICELDCLPLWLEYLATNQGAEFTKIAKHIDMLGQSAYLPLLELSRNPQPIKSYAIQFLDRLEETCRRRHGWFAWLTLKQQRILGIFL